MVHALNVAESLLLESLHHLFEIEIIHFRQNPTQGFRIDVTDDVDNNHLLATLVHEHSEAGDVAGTLERVEIDLLGALLHAKDLLPTGAPEGSLGVCNFLNHRCRIHTAWDPNLHPHPLEIGDHFGEALILVFHGSCSHTQHGTAEVDINFEVPRPDDTYVLCSDGLSGMITDEKILATYQRYAHDLNLVVSKLIEEANAAGGADNVTAIAVRFPGETN